VLMIKTSCGESFLSVGYSANAFKGVEPSPSWPETDTITSLTVSAFGDLLAVSRNTFSIVSIQAYEITKRATQVWAALFVSQTERR
jgi:hypothetical protein